MLMTKKNVIVYTIQLETEEIQKKVKTSIDLIDLFEKEFEKEGMAKEAAKMQKGGFSYRETEKNSYYTEYEVSITTRRVFL